MSYIKRLAYHRIYIRSKDEAEVIRNFYELLYVSKTWGLGYPKWRGESVAKHPNDLITLQEILWETRPTLYIETGTYHGGGALFVADMMDAMGIDQGKVLSIDLGPIEDLPAHPRISYYKGSSVGEGARQLLEDYGITQTTGERIMVSLDSDHSKAHVLKELDIYASLVSPGCYLIVEDTAFNGHPISPEYGPGPWEALDEWLPTPIGQQFMVDRSRESYIITSNPRGYLRRKAAAPTGTRSDD